MSDDIFLKGTDATFAANFSRDKLELERLRSAHHLNKKADGLDEQQEKEKAAADFESLMLKQMLGAMWKTVPKNGMLSGSREEEYYRDFFNDAIAEHITESQGIGIKEVILRDMNKYGGGEEK